MSPFSNASLPLARASLEGDWVADRSIITYGVPIGVRTNRAEFLDRILGYAPPLWHPASNRSVERLFSFRLGGRGSAHLLLDDRETAVKFRSLKAILETFAGRVKMHVAEMAPRRVFVHAGVVGWRGRAILIPGRSLSGKTSLVLELVRAGAIYYSDEYAVLDTRGRVHAYPQPLQVRKPGSIRQKRISVESIGGITGTDPLPVGQVVFSRYKPDARWRPTRLSPGQGALELLDNTVPARRQPRLSLAALQRVAPQAVFLKGNRGEASELARWILEFVEDVDPARK